jgi:hypothetical protein
MDDDADRLYGLPLAEFVPERTALAKRLRADGRRDEAAVVAKLPKPTVAAWAANQVLRSQPADARALFAAGDALAQADRTTLRDAIAAHREVLGRLMAAARGLLDPDGRSLTAATTEKVMQTLNAASLDPELRDEARAARLVREHTFSGLGLRPAPPGPSNRPDAPVGGPRAGKKAKPKRKGPDPKKVAAARKRVAKAEAELAEARKALDDLLAE